jgi:hypothetical protein
MTPKWRSILVRGELSPALRSEIENASGAYAIREKASHRVVYVGESSRGRMWKTMLRHFQAPESFRKVRESGVFATSPERYELAVWITSKGKRPRAKDAAPDQAAMAAQATWIATLDPKRNKDDGFVYEPSTEDEDPWGGLVSNPPGKPNPDKTILSRQAGLDAMNVAQKRLAAAVGLEKKAKADRSLLSSVGPAYGDAALHWLVAADALEESGSAGMAEIARESARLAEKEAARPWVKSVEKDLAFEPSAGPWRVVRLTSPAAAKRLAMGIIKRCCRAYDAGAKVITNATHEEVSEVLQQWKGRVYLGSDALPDAAELAKGTDVEKEHTTDPKLALSIAVDHLLERPDYYKLLSLVEKAPRTPRSGFVLQEGNPRPSGRLVELGKLTGLSWAGGSHAWALRDAPSLVYDAKGRLLIVYDAARTEIPASSAGRASFTKTHWGTAPAGASLSAGEFAEGPWRERGPGVAIVYTTRKGTREKVDFEHVWGEGGKGKFTPPTVVSHRCGVHACKAEGRFALHGGSYRVTDRGIVG